MKTRVKICCIASEEEARTAISFGASALGLVAAMPSGPGPIADDLILRSAHSVPPPVATLLLTCETAVMPNGPGPIADDLILRIAHSVPPPVATFLLTCETEADAIIVHHLRTLTNTLQLVDVPEKGAYEAIRAALPAIKIVQVIHVRGQDSIDEALLAAEYADALLLDSGNPTLAVKELGGTDRVHDWRISRSIVELSPLPVFLAGGLHAGNIREAIDQVQPFGVDLCSGVRTEGHLDPKKLAAFFNALLY